MDVIALTEALVSIKSTFDEPPYENAIGTYLESWLESHGFSTRRQLVNTRETEPFSAEYPRFNVLAEKGSGEKSLLLYGHMDTVQQVEGWTREPFDPTLAGDRLYGLGAYDMKGGLAAILCAAAQAEISGYKLKVALLVDEENMSRGAYALAQDAWLDDVVLAMVPESGTSEQTPLGARMLTLGRRGRITIEVTVAGIAAHAAEAYKGVSALHRAAQILVGLQEAVDAGEVLQTTHPQLKQGSLSVRRIDSGTHSLSIPDKATFLIDRHLVPDETPELALAEIRDVIRRLQNSGRLAGAVDLPVTVTLKERENPYLMPYVIAEDHPYVRQVSAVIQSTLGAETVQYNYGASVADENYFGASQALGGRDLPVIVMGTAGDGNHAADEWVSVESLHDLTLVYENILRQFGAWV